MRLLPFHFNRTFRVSEPTEGPSLLPLYKKKILVEVLQNVEQHLLHSEELKGADILGLELEFREESSPYDPHPLYRWIAILNYEKESQ